MKSWLFTLIVVVITIVAATIAIQFNKIEKLQNELTVSKNNVEVLLDEGDSLRRTSNILMLTVKQLNSYTDSTLRRMNELRKELDIKDNEIKALQYELSTASKTDTIVFRDTIFRDPEFKLDTLMRDSWYSLAMTLEYPSRIIVHPTFRSERIVTMSLSKETVNPASKCWFIRLFQKKHQIMTVNILEKNPYIKMEEQEYVKIIE